MSDVIARSGVSSNLKRAFVNASASGNTLLVAAPGANRKIRVISVNIVAAAGVTVKFQTNVTDISSGKALAANGGLVLPANELGWYECALNDPLNINLGGAVAVGVDISYVVVS